MSFNFRCPNCNAKLEAEDEWLGMETTCPKCSKDIPIVKSTSTPPPLPSTPSPIHPHENSQKYVCGKCDEEIARDSKICPHCGVRRDWFRIELDNEISGPFSKYDLKRDIESGATNANDYIWKFGQNGWRRFDNSEIKDLLWADIPPVLQKKPRYDLENNLKMLTLAEVILSVMVFCFCLRYNANHNDTISYLNLIGSVFTAIWYITIIVDGFILQTRKYEIGFSFLYWTPYYLLRRAKILQYSSTLTPGYFGIYLFLPFAITFALKLVINAL